MNSKVMARPPNPLVDVFNEVSDLRLRLPGLLGVGPEPSPSPLQPIAARVDKSLGGILTMLAAAVLQRSPSPSGPEAAAAPAHIAAVTLANRLLELANETSDVLGTEHPLAGQLALIADYTRMTALAAT